METVIAWYSCGVTSAVACKMALNMYDNVDVYYIDTGSQDDDSHRFFLDCEKWFGRKINVVRNPKFKSYIDVIKYKKWINGPTGASCTNILKKEMRYKVQDAVKVWGGQVFGFDANELKRAARFTEQNPTAKPLYPLIEKNLTKAECIAMLTKAGIEIPLMYRLGYNNNNCVGCVKGGIGYWNKIRQDFPSQFWQMARLEREIGASCLMQEIKGRKKIPLYLDELEPNRGHYPKEIMPECGIFCEIEFMNL